MPQGGERHVGATRKLINAGWDRPGPRFLARNAAAMQESPFDGLVFNLWEAKPNHRVGNTWRLFHQKEPRHFTNADVDIDAFGRIKWTTFTDNFIAANPCPYRTPGIDFFSEDVWEAARRQMRLMGQVLQASGARGIWFNPQGGLGGMQYTVDNYPGRSFGEVAGQARHRGAQFMCELQRAKPDIQILFTFLRSTARYRFDDDDPTTTPYALLPHFVSGMLEAASQEAAIIDGSEHDIFHDDTQRYPRSRQYLDRAQYSFPRQDQERAACIRTGSAVYADLLMGIARGESFDASRFSFHERVRDDPEFGRRWMTHNVYHAMLKSDNYVWLWNERMSWWNPTTLPLPPDVDDAVRDARAAFHRGSALGYDMCRAGRSGVPAFVSTPTIDLQVAPGSVDRHRGGDTVVLLGTPKRTDDEPEVDHVTFYDNSHVVEETHVDDWRTTVQLRPGEHTFHAVGFNSDGTHCSSNPVTIRVA